MFDKMKNEKNISAYNVYKKYLRNQLQEQNDINPAILLRK